MDYVTLNNDVKMPMEGFGVFKYPKQRFVNRLSAKPLLPVID